ncbi:serine hydrolase [Roseimicrobium sp. ORNL1]|uniref:serine hydrolase n=1 Tax=Roseimicrobium sp. ORNL1 TaxID=2711231 RepID=UPI0013E14269|nr:serine hydrolase [Roseimicrobium sp. ORNL1]QIF04322.1 serine hydrolase [Roseimicrobium sp. ORNL1]
MNESELESALVKIAGTGGVVRASVAAYDHETGRTFGWHEQEWFHAASTMKVAVLLAVFRAVDEKRLRLDDPLHVRNRFISAGNGEPFRLQRGRDGDEEVHQRIGRTMRIRELAHRMITVSSNLATNLLLDLIGLEYAQRVLHDAGVTGIHLKRGVEDAAAHEMGINNEVTSAGLVSLFRVIQEGQFTTAKSREAMLQILFDQKYNAVLPKKLPPGTRVAHKTGEISTVSHDAGLFFVKERPPYAFAILTEVLPESNGRTATVAAMSEAVCDYFRGA